MKKLVGAVAILILIIGTLAYAFTAGFDESRYFSRYSLDYYLLVQSRYVKQFPIPDGVGAVTYYSSCGDGPKPPRTAVEIKDIPELTPDYLASVERFASDSGLKQTSGQGITELSRGMSTNYENEQGDVIEITSGRETNGRYTIALEHIEY